MKKKYEKNFALSQIFLLVISIVAFGYAIGSEIGEVSGAAVDSKGYCENSPRDVQGQSKYICYLILGSKAQFTQSDKPITKIEDFKGLQFKELAASVEDVSENFDAKKTKTGVAITTFSDFKVDTNAEGEFNSFINPPPKDDGPPLCDGKPCPPQAKTADITCTKYYIDNNLGGCGGKKEGEVLKGVKCEGGNIALSECAAASQIIQGAGLGYFVKYLGGSLLAAAAFYGAVKFAGPLVGLGEETSDTLGKAVGLGVLVGGVLQGGKEAWGWGISENAIYWVGGAAAAAYFLKEYRDIDTKSVEFSCIPWQPGLGGDDCEKCNQGFLPCSEYQCKSLGQSCELVNKGTTEEECVWVNRNDVSPPTIEAWEDALLNGYRYVPDDAISPPDRGVKIDYDLSSDGCVPAFTPLKFGVILSEPASCKVDKLRKDNFESMDVFMSEGLSLYNHTFSLTLPGTSGLNSSGVEVQNDGNYDLFVRCQDSNGNFNIGTFVFKYCIDKGPDTTPPLIVATNVKSGLPIAFNQSSLDLEVYVNEPSECKWSPKDRAYENMENTMTCSTTLGSTNAQGLYTCRTTLTGMKDRVENEFFFKCKDKPNAPETDRNVNVESFRYVVLGTQPLVIKSVKPNNTIVKDSRDAVKVTFEAETFAGYKDGGSTCYYSDTGLDDDYITFFKTNSFTHSQDLFLPEGSYLYYIKCTDLGGNSDNKTITFTVNSDNEAPIVARAYHEEIYLKLTTNEEARCVYDVVDCTYNFEDGIEITTTDDFSHFVNWDLQSSLYIKCKDEFDNQPNPNTCSIIARSSDF